MTKTQNNGLSATGVQFGEDGQIVPSGSDIEAVGRLHSDKPDAELYRLGQAEALLRSLGFESEDE